MNKKAKQTGFMIVLLCVALGFSALAGCSGNTDSPSAETTPTAASTATSSSTATPATEPEVVYEYSWTSNFTTEADGKASEVRQFLEQKFNIKLTPVSMRGEDYATHLNLLAASDEIPDIIGYVQPDFVENWAKQGILASFSLEQLKELMPNYTRDVETFGGNSLWSRGKVDGQLYGLPLGWFDSRMQSSSPKSGNVPIVGALRKDWLDNLGITLDPEVLASRKALTIDELEAILVRFRNEDPNQNGKKDEYATSVWWDTPFPVEFGAYIGSGVFDWTVDGQGAFVPGFLKVDGMKAAMKKLNNWYDMGLIDPEFLTEKTETFNQKWFDGKLGYYPANNPHGYNRTADFFKNSQAKSADYDVVILEPLIGPDGRQATESWGTFSELLAINANVAKDEGRFKKLLEVLDFMYSDPETHRIINYGWEGKGLTKNEDGTYTTSGEGSLSVLDTYRKYGILFYRWGRGSSIDSKLWFPDENLSPFEQEIAVANPEILSENLKWKQMPAEKDAPDINTMIKEFIVKAIIGQIKDIDTEYDAVVTKWKNAGGDKILQEAGEWYQLNK